MIRTISAFAVAGLLTLGLAFTTGDASAQTKQRTVNRTATTAQAPGARKPPSVREEQLIELYNRAPRFVGDNISYGSGGGWRQRLNRRPRHRTEQTIWARQAQGMFDQ
jgi:hypothetical protein